MSKSTAKRKRPNGATALALARWHRRLGIAAALVVVWLAVSGMLLGHTDDIGLDARYARAGWLLDWYGVGAPDQITAYRVGEDWIIHAGETIYFNTMPIAGEHAAVQGSVALANEVVIAAGDELLVLTRTGDMVETLGRAHGVPGALRAIGRQDGSLVVRTESHALAADHALLAWRPVAGDVEWSEPLGPPAALSARIADHYRGRILTLERVLLDLHSGRLFGRFGVLFMDLAAVAFLVLAFSGLWMWLLRRNGSPPKRK